MYIVHIVVERHVNVRVTTFICHKLIELSKLCHCLLHIIFPMGAISVMFENCRKSIVFRYYNLITNEATLFHFQTKRFVLIVCMYTIGDTSPLDDVCVRLISLHCNFSILIYER